MSRQKDVEVLNTRISELEKSLQETVAKYQKYAKEVEATVKEILTQVGVYDKVRDMELKRNEIREKAQAKLNEVQQELVDKRKIRDFLVSRDNSDKVLAPVEDTTDDDGSPVPPSFDDEPSELDKEPEAPKLGEGDEKVVGIPTENSDGASDKPETPEL